MTDAVYFDDLALLTNTLAQAKPILHNLEQLVRRTGLYVNANKTELMCFKQGAISTLSGKPLKLVDQLPYHGSNITFTDSDVNICLVRV